MVMGHYDIGVVDDELANLESLERILKSDGANVTLFQNPHEALVYLQKNSIDILLTDLRMSSLNGLELLEATKMLDPTIEVILITAYGTVELAVQAMKKGAYDFITKPLQRVQVLRSVHRALEKRRLVNENSFLKEELKTHLGQESCNLIGKSEAVRQMMEVARQAARSRANILIEGESGTGKGVLAEYLHRNSERSQGIFVKINCTAIPENLLEAELFGYEAGAFTGATRRKKGRVELAHEGTLFLDEIGIAPLTLQTKLLRFLQEGEFERLGSNETLRVQTRVISATNSDLKTAIRNGQLREDLYYRLNVIHVRVPSLRERQEDVPLLARKFLEESAKKNGREMPMIHSDAMECLTRYSWPGNIRELQNLLERMVVLNRTGVIQLEDLPPEIVADQRQKTMVIPVGLPLKEVERMIMDETLRSTRGDKKLTAKLLGVHPRTIYRYLETLGPSVGGDLPSDLAEGEPREPKPTEVAP
jgi:two-component system, NtrC family, response regulator HydG